MTKPYDLNSFGALNDYLNKEGLINNIDKTIIDYFENIDATKFTSTQKTEIINLLNEIKAIIYQNKANLDKMNENIVIAKNLIQNEINELESEDTINDLAKYNINPDIFEICAEQFNIFYSRIQELNYRMNVLNYKTTIIKDQRQNLDNDIELINKYIIALT